MDLEGLLHRDHIDRLRPNFHLRHLLLSRVSMVGMGITISLPLRPPSTIPHMQE
jgi:hypothetical protein